jgi:serine protease AprX
LTLPRGESRSVRLSVKVFVPVPALAVILVLLTYAPILAQGPQPIEAQQLADISVYLENQFTVASEPVSFLVILDAQAEAEELASQAVFSSATGETARRQRGEALYRSLTEAALSAQAPVRAWLDAHGVAYRPFYIVNMIEVQGDAELAYELRTLPGVDRLAANPLVYGQGPVATDPVHAWLSLRPIEGLLSASTWAPGLYGLPYTHAPEVWDLGYTGQGIVVASQDTGVQWDHPALIEKYRGYYPSTGGVMHRYNWFDAWAEPSPEDLCGPNHQVPCDDNGHGTHTVGTMLGDATSDTSNGFTNLGMAPDAEWIGCRNMRNNFGTPATYAACFEFMLAPYPQNGDPFTDGRPDLAPHIVNNSWSCPPGEGCDADSLRQVVEVSRAAGQLVVASAGNYGPSCATVKYPVGLHDAVFTAGAHDQNGSVASFSSRGPVSVDGSNRLKPDLVAPGVAVLSTIPHDNYGRKSGTSMSSPHVAGAAGLGG